MNINGPLLNSFNLIQRIHQQRLLSYCYILLWLAIFIEADTKIRGKHEGEHEATK